jgi:predicted ATPase
LFKRALQVARTQDARSWELRAATSLARLWRDLDRHGQAAELLLPIVRRLREGLLTPDVTEAIALANELKAVTS